MNELLLSTAISTLPVPDELVLFGYNYQNQQQLGYNGYALNMSDLPAPGTASVQTTKITKSSKLTSSPNFLNVDPAKVGSAFQTGNDFTMEVVGLLTGASSAFSTFIGMSTFASGSDEYPGYYYGLGDNQFSNMVNLTYDTNNRWRGYPSRADLVNRWHTFGLMKKGNQVSLLIDGKPVTITHNGSSALSSSQQSITHNGFSSTLKRLFFTANYEIAALRCCKVALDPKQFLKLHT